MTLEGVCVVFRIVVEVTRRGNFDHAQNGMERNRKRLTKKIKKEESRDGLYRTDD